MTLTQASLPFHYTAGIIIKHHDGQSCWEHAVSDFTCASSPLFHRGCPTARPSFTTHDWIPVFSDACLCVYNH